MSRLRLLLPAAALLVASGAASRALVAREPTQPAVHRAIPTSAVEAVDLAVIERIRDEGLHRSQVMETIGYLVDVIGPRLTGSPGLRKANDWTRQKLADWGLTNAHLEPWTFGRGWWWTHAAVTLVSPRQAELYAYPKAWSPAIAGRVRAALARIEVRSEKDLERYRGKLAGKIVLVEQPDPPRPTERRATGRRLTDSDLADLAEFPIPAERTPEFRKTRLERFQTRKALRTFLVEEKAVATLDGGSQPWGEMGVQSGGFTKREDGDGVPGFVIAREHAQLLRRLLDANQPVELEVELTSQYLDSDPLAYNTIAEIPGSDRNGELVMAGAHLDSWHAGTGATDNAAGCAVVLEAARILKTLGIKPRRTIRVALWTGEEEGLLGSQAYVAAHFATRAENPADKDLPDFLREAIGPLTLRAEYGKLSAYFNVDNGSGKIRGIFAQENAAARPIFEVWLAPLADLGATTVTLRQTGSTDHVPFDRVGLPAFQFIQDPLDYSPHTHHTQWDVFDHLEREDLMQASVVLASFLYDAAMRPAPLPRRPLPPTPAVTPAAAPASRPTP
jgi:carboxypeptidase Q